MTYEITDISNRLAEHTPFIEPSQGANRHAAVAMILRDGDSDGLETLFIQRAEHPEDPWSGHMAFPGGRRDDSDLDLTSVAIRETVEEVGIELDPGMALGRLDDLMGGRLQTQQLSVSTFVFYHPSPPAFSLNVEVADAVWVPLEYLSNLNHVRPYVFPMDPMKREFPSFQYNQYTIWGLTFRIVSNFFRLYGIEHPGEPEITDVE